ncbi:hypothetical protein [Sphingobacterium sp.]|uniref:hypothetical protein n=1 Tax=Sphingobacterium sp. TaxID=341027 RepID=UPI0028AC7B18|nr:hypothetical protein [Sphingobacterium sp.]
MKQNIPYWQNLLKHFETKHYFINGLTLPFVIGPGCNINEQAALLTIEEVFKDFEESGEYINVVKCDGIGEYVFRIGNKEDAEIYPTKGFLIIIDDCFKNYPTIADIVLHLNDRYSHLIEGGKYSKIQGVWGNFDELDIARIDEVKEIH